MKGVRDEYPSKTLAGLEESHNPEWNLARGPRPETGPHVQAYLRRILMSIKPVRGRKLRGAPV
jgi:hypothetical protein